MDTKPKFSKGSFIMLFLILWCITYELILGVIYNILDNTPYVSIFSSPLFIIVSQIIMFVIPMGIMVKRGGGDPFQWPSAKPGYVNVILIIALSLLIQPCIMLISGISSLLFPNNIAAVVPQFNNESFIIVLAALAVTPALCEEAFFRGLVDSKYRHLGLKGAALINGLFFAIIHLDLQQFLYAFVMGVIFTVFVRITRSIVTSILSHFIINATQLLLIRLASSPVLAELAVEADPDAAGGIGWVILTLAIQSLIVLPIIIILFRVFISHNKRRQTRHEILKGMRVNLDDGDEGQSLAAGEGEDAAEDGKNNQLATIGEKDEVPPLQANKTGGRVFDICFWVVIGVFVLYCSLWFFS